MATYYFIITNPNHHWDNVKPVISLLQKENRRVEVISFCELRRLKSPTDEARRLGIEIWRCFPHIPGAKPSSGATTLGEVGSKKREYLYRFLFYLFIKPLLSFKIKQGDKIVHFNDIAFPGNLITPWVKKKGIKQAMIQEGIRFPLPQEKTEVKYGSRGADIIFCWGELSKKHFTKIAQPETSVVIAGSPRYQSILGNLRKRTEVKDSKKKIGIFTNPIDDQGFCSHSEKMGLFEDIVKRIAETLRRKDIGLVLKPHPRENIKEYEDLLLKYQVRYDIGPANIFECIFQVEGGIIFASSVGLELLYAGKNVAQVKLPKYNYVFDYVENGAVLPVDAASGGEEIIEYLVGKGTDHSGYLAKHLNSELNSSEIIANKIIGL